MVFKMGTKNCTSLIHNLSNWIPILMWDTSIILWLNSLIIYMNLFFFKEGQNFTPFIPVTHKVEGYYILYLGESMYVTYCMYNVLYTSDRNIQNSDPISIVFHLEVDSPFCCCCWERRSLRIRSERLSQSPGRSRSAGPSLSICVVSAA